eukprot:scpid61129/ scgid29579/ 
MAAVSLPMSGLDVYANFPDNLPDLSPSTVEILRGAIQSARERGHKALGTEHVLWALLTLASSSSGGMPRAAQFIVETMGSACTIENLRRCRQQVEAELQDRPLWAARSGKSPGTLPLTRSLNDAFHLMAQFSRSPVADGSLGVVHPKGLVATEFLLAGILAEGTSVAADILQRLSRGKINSQKILNAISVDVTTLTRRTDDKPWMVEHWVPAEPNRRASGAASSMPTQAAAWCPEFGVLTPIDSLGNSPTPTSNWLIPERLLIGGKPGGYYQQPDEDLLKYIGVGVRTFVCLIGEYRSMEGYMQRYPGVAKEVAKNADDCTGLDFVFFPIYDFETPKPTDLQTLVLELKRRILSGEVLFVHCLGGHGRTGTVVIPLVMALYCVDYRTAETYVNDTTAKHRKSDRGYRHSMPETDEQASLAERSEQYVKKNRR